MGIIAKPRLVAVESSPAPSCCGSCPSSVQAPSRGEGGSWP